MVFLKLCNYGTKESDAIISHFATPEDRAGAMAKKTVRAQQRHLLSRAALRSILAHVTGDHNWQLHVDTHGKPYVSNIDGKGPHISISHSHTWVACALSTQGEIGVDIEQWKLRDFIAIANYAFGPREREAVEQSGESAFYRIWTLREAMAKATGHGMLQELDGTDAITVFSDKEKWVSEKWNLFYCTPQENCSLAVAALNNNVSSEFSVHWIE